MLVIRTENKHDYTEVYKLNKQAFNRVEETKFGLKPASDLGITSPWEVPDEVFMVFELKENALKDICGSVNYARTFAEI